MFGLTFGEWFVVTFITVAVVSAGLWPRLFAMLWVWLFGREAAGSVDEESSNER